MSACLGVIVAVCLFVCGYYVYLCLLGCAFFFLRMEEKAFVCLDAIACLFVRTRRLHIPDERLTD